MRREGESQIALEVDVAALAERCALLVETQTTLEIATAQQLVVRFATLRCVC